MSELISLREAATRGIERVRLPIWINTLDHLKIDIVEGGQLGPWVHLFGPFNMWCNGRDPVDILWPITTNPGNSWVNGDADAKSFEPYVGPLPDSAEYKAAVAHFGVLPGSS